MKIRPVGAEFFNAERHRQKKKNMVEANSRFLQFCETRLTRRGPLKCLNVSFRKINEVSKTFTQEFESTRTKTPTA
jgi:hypothetical protein